MQSQETFVFGTVIFRTLLLQQVEANKFGAFGFLSPIGDLIFSK